MRGFEKWAQEYAVENQALHDSDGVDTVEVWKDGFLDGIGRAAILARSVGNEKMALLIGAIGHGRVDSPAKTVKEE